MKKESQYLFIALMNWIVLMILLALWVDKFERIFNDWVILVESLKVLFFSLASLGAMHLVRFVFRNREGTVFNKARMGLVVTLLVSSYLYVSYSIKLVKHRMIDRGLRNGIVHKIKQPMRQQMEVVDLTRKEYDAIRPFTGLPMIPAEASSISYTYQAEGFLPDYYFELTYDLPLDISVDTFHSITARFRTSRTSTRLEDRQKVTYLEEQN